MIKNHVLFIFCLLLFLLHNCRKNPIDSIDKEADYHFKGSISEDVLRNYLSHSITMSNLLLPEVQEYMDENIDMILNIDAKFIGRAIFLWSEENRLPFILAEAEPKLGQVHAADSDIIVQAAIFEIITTDVEKLQVPDWVFQEFNLPVIVRHFDYEAMLPVDSSDIDFYGSGKSVPDISRLETRLWFFYLAANYMKIGVEAIHLGQFSWMSAWDEDYTYASSITDRIHRYAKLHARRGYILLDAHVESGMKKGETLILDFHSCPLRIKEGKNQQQGVLEENFCGSIYGKSLGGLTPSGWHADHLPYLVEFDHGYAYDWAPGECPKEECIWGFDEISWFALVLSESERNAFLEYVWHWVRTNDPAGYVEMPGVRPLQAEGETGIDWYFAHSPDRMLYGYNQEETIKAIWNSN